MRFAKLFVVVLVMGLMALPALAQSTSEPTPVNHMLRLKWAEVKVSDNNHIVLVLGYNEGMVGYCYLNGPDLYMGLSISVNENALGTFARMDLPTRTCSIVVRSREVKEAWEKVINSVFALDVVPTVMSSKR